MADHRVQGFKVSTLWPDGPRNVERRSACDRRPTKSQDAHAQCALKIGPSIAIPGALPGPEHSVWAPLSSLSWSLKGVTAARAGRHHLRRARSRGPRQTRAKRVPCEARPDGGRRVAPSGPGPSTCSRACVRPCLHRPSFFRLLSHTLPTRRGPGQICVLHTALRSIVFEQKRLLHARQSIGSHSRLWVGMERWLLL